MRIRVYNRVLRFVNCRHFRQFNLVLPRATDRSTNPQFVASPFPTGHAPRFWRPHGPLHTIVNTSVEKKELILFCFRMVDNGGKWTRREQRHKKLLEFVTLGAQVCLTLTAFIILAIRNEVHTSEWGFRQRASFVVFVPAFCAWVAARVELSKYSCFAVMPVIPPKLVQTGCYSYLRHPIYVTSFL